MRRVVCIKSEPGHNRDFNADHDTQTPDIYRPQTKLREGYVFTAVSDSVHRGGVCLSACWDTTPPEQTPPNWPVP